MQDYDLSPDGKTLEAVANNFEGHFRIPDSVVVIGEEAFYGCEQLTSVDIPCSVTTIEINAFQGCQRLERIWIPSSVVSIDTSAFYECTGLKSIKVDPANPAYDSRNSCNAIIDSATNSLISGCSESIIPDSVSVIGPYAFVGCNGLTEIVIPNSVTNIGLGAFQYCTGLKSIILPESLTIIEDDAFYGCTGLTSIVFPDSVEWIAPGAFVECSNLKSVELPYSLQMCNPFPDCDLSDFIVRIGSEVKVLEQFAILRCATGVQIPDSVTTIASRAFASSFLKSIDLPDSLQSIEDYAFLECEDLNSLVIPSSVRYISNRAFFGSYIEEFHVRWEHPEELSVSPKAFITWEDWDWDSCVLYVPVGTLDAYRRHPVFGQFIKIIEEP